MYLIPCNDNCIYQKEGYCILETPTVITNNDSNGCLYCVRGEKDTNNQ